MRAHEHRSTITTVVPTTFDASTTVLRRMSHSLGVLLGKLNNFFFFTFITFCICCFLTRVLSRSGSNGYCCVSSSSASMMMTLNVLSHNGSRTQFHNVLHNSIQTDFKLTIFLERCSLLYVDTPPSIGVGLKTGTPFFSLYTRKKEATMAIAASAKPTESPTTRPVFLPPASSLAALRLVR